MLLNRISGLLVAVAGLALLFVVIPAQTETVDYGWVRPKTVPDILAVALIGLGLAQAVWAHGATELDGWTSLRAGLFLAFAAVSVAAMGRVGFVAVAPVMMLALMLWLGERRPLWLGIGTIAIPGLIWVVVIVLLDRTLPG